MMLSSLHSRCLAFALALTLVVALCSCSGKSSSGYEGYVEGKYVYVASPQGGRLDQLHVTRGEVVTASHPLFVLDQEPELSAERQAEGALRADEARLADLQTGKRPPEIDSVRAQLAQAKSELQKSIDLLRSYEMQYAGGGIAETDLITARAAVTSNTAVVRQYESNIAVAELPGRSEQIRAQAQLVAADRAAIQQAAWKLQQKQIAAPRDGLIFDTLFRQGEWVPAGNPVVQILPPENVEVRFFVPEPLVGTLKLSQNVTVHCDGCAADIPAAITFISNQVEYTPPVIYSNENRSKLVFMVIAKPSPDKAPLLHPGQPLEVTLQ
jgi:HlyD family secretion protein